MARQSGIIEINGRLYNSHTGKPVNPRSAAPKPQGRTIDGFVRPAVKPVATSQKTLPTVAPKPASKPDVHRSTPKHVARSTQKSTTLMRTAVRKPTLTTTKPSATVERKNPQVSVRQQRASSVQKSALISRYGHLKAPTIQKRTEPLPIKPAPVAKTTKPAMQTTRGAALTTPRVKPVQTTARPNSSHAQTEKLFSDAIAAATNFEAPKAHAKKRRKKGSKTAAFASAALAAILLIGFFAYQNIPNLTMRVAATRAGFAADLPDYRPAGFAVKGPINYEAGKVSVNFGTGVDERNYSVTQQVSSWNSETLVDNYLEAQNKDFQTYQDKGRTIYLYDGGNATWVNGGIWYQVESNQALSSDQLLKIAASL